MLRILTWLVNLHADLVEHVLADALRERLPEDRERAVVRGMLTYGL